MGKVFKWIGLSIGSFIVMVVIVFFALVFLKPMDEATRTKVLANNDRIVSQLLKQKEEELSFLNTRVTEMNEQILSVGHVRDSLREQLEFKDKLLLEFQKTVDNLNGELVAMKKQTGSILELAKTYETMKIEEIRPILTSVDDNTVIELYKNINARMRKNILVALPNNRAARITQKLAQLKG